MKMYEVALLPPPEPRRRKVRLQFYVALAETPQDAASQVVEDYGWVPGLQVWVDPNPSNGPYQTSSNTLFLFQAEEMVRRIMSYKWVKPEETA